MLDAVLSKTRRVWIRTNTVSPAIPEKSEVAWRILAVAETVKQFLGLPTTATDMSGFGRAITANFHTQTTWISLRGV